MSKAAKKKAFGSVFEYGYTRPEGVYMLSRIGQSPEQHAVLG